MGMRIVIRKRSHRSLPIRLGGALVAVALVLAACGGDDGGGSSESEAPEAGSASEVSEAGYPVSIENCGRTLTFESAPTEVLASYQPTLEVLIGLGVADRVIARGEYEGAELVPLLPQQAAQLESIPVEQSAMNRPPLKEEAITLGPDFVLASGPVSFEFDAAAGFATLDEWADAGAQVYLSQCTEEQGAEITIEDTYQVILDLGWIFDVSAAAEERVEQMKAQISAVQEKVADREPVKVLIVYTTDDPPLVQGSSIEGRVVEAAGGENVLADQPQFFPANDEAIAAEDIDAVLVFPAYGPQVDTLFERYPNLDASRDRRSVTTNYVLTGGGVAGAWRIADAVDQLARQLHPSAFPE